ncbi:MAG: hypothetical protein ACPGTP_02240, partial [Bacteroidia bacterium]
MIKIKSSLFSEAQKILKLSLLTALLVLTGINAEAQITATISPQPVGDIEFCVAPGSSTAAQNFTITATTACGGVNALAYQWYVGSTALAPGGGPGYNSGTAATLTITSLQAMYTAGTISCNDTLICIINETGAGCTDIDTVGGWVFKPVTDVPTASLTSDQTVCQGNAATFNLDITGPAGCSGELTVNWNRYDFSGAAKGARIDILDNWVAGVDTSYTFSAASNILAADQDSIQARVSNVCGIDTSSNILTVMPVPNMFTNGNLNYCQGDTGSAQNASITVSNAELDAASGGASVDWTFTTTVLGDNPVSVAALQGLMDKASNNSGTGSGVFNVDLTDTTLSAGTYTIVYTTIGKDAGSPLGSPSCPRTLTNTKIDVTIYPEPSVEFSKDSVHMCEGTLGESFDVIVGNAEYGSPSAAVSWTYTYNENGGSVANSCAAGGSGLLTTVTGTGNTTQTISLDGLAAGIYTFKLTGISNNTNTCTGSATGIDSITIHVSPNPYADLSSTAESVCEGDSGSFMITVTDAEYCSAPGVLTDFDWEVSYTDAVASSALDSVNTGSTTVTELKGTGNGVYNLLSNDGGALPPGIYDFEMSSAVRVGYAPGCSQTLISNNKYTLTVNPEPTLTAVVSTEEICEGTSGEKITITVSNAELDGVGQSWSVSFTQAGRAIASGVCGGSNYDPGLIPSPFTGTGNGTLEYDIPDNLVVGKYQYIFNGISNSSGSCMATMVADTIEFQIDPIPVVSFLPDQIDQCEDNTNPFDMKVTNAYQCVSAETGGTEPQAWTVSLTDAVTGSAFTTKSGNGDSAAITYYTGITLPVGDHHFVATNIVNDSSAVSCAKVLTDTFTVTVHPRPVANFAADVVEVCEGSTGMIGVTVSNSVLNGEDQNWEIESSEISGTLASGCTPGTGTPSNVLGATGVFVGDGDTTHMFTVPGTLAPGIYQFFIDQVTNTDGPCTGETGAQDSMTLIVNPRPFVSITEPSASICESDSTLFNIVVTGGETCDSFNSTKDISWTVAYDDQANSDLTSLAGSGDSTVMVYANSGLGLAPGNHYFSVGTITAGGSCDSATVDTFHLTINPEPVVTFDAASLTMCENESGNTVTATVSNAVLNGADVNWTVSFTETSALAGSNCVAAGALSGFGPTYSSDGDTTITFDVPSTTPAGIYTFKLDAIATDFPCNGTIGAIDSFTLIVNPTAVVNIVQETASICEGDSAVLNIDISNANRCDAVGSVLDATWSLVVSDLASSSHTGSPITGSGDSLILGYANSLLGLPQLGPGSHSYSTSMLTSNPGSCDTTIVDTFHLTINPEPVVTFDA